ncbi:uncharacterized protein METZ01_LOCUS20726 [marine metagenome]|uniref:Type IX secretion system membrane protein PorP/SprF n=1 Tax=marine metagenome TaxID=408172 RepID=A0A381PLG0_9ZZZZ
MKKNSLLKKIFITTLFFSVFNLIYAQQDPYFSTYLINPSIVNTSLSSVNTNNNVVLIYRNQWLNYSSTWEMGNNGNSPNTQILSLNMKSRDKVYSFGLNLISDDLGPKSSFNFSPYFGLKKKIGNSFISFSLSPSFKSTTLDFGSLIFVDSSDPFNVGGKETQSKPDVAFGISYFSDKLLLSVGLKNISQPSFNFGLKDLVNKEFTNITFLGKYTISVDRDLFVEPYLLLRTDLISYTFDVSALATYKEKFNFGTSYRYEEAVVMFLGYKFLKKNKLFVGYAFDYVTNNVSAKSATSHEIVFRYDLPTPQLKKPIRTPRFIY